MAKTVTVFLDLPVDFQEACKTAGIRAGQTIQSFIHNVSIYSFMVTPPTMEACSLASAIFREYVHGRKIKPMANPDKRDIGLFYMKLMVQLVRSKSSREKKEKTYQDIIDEWYADLLKIDKV
jgi:hypothetical protein